MEPAGIVVGVAGLAGLFSSCLEVIQRVKYYQAFGTDSETLEVRLEAAKVRFMQWGPNVGIVKGVLLPGHHSALDNHDISMVVTVIFRIIMKTVEDEFNSLKPDQVQNPDAKRLESRRRKIAWALWRKEQRKEQIEQFERLVEDLHGLVDPARVGESTSTTIARSNRTGPGRTFSLVLASSKGNVEVVKKLLDKDADMTVTNELDWTPIFGAAYNGHTEVVKLLLDKGADFSVVNDAKWTPLYAASNNGHVDVVKLFLERGADITTVTHDGWTPLQTAADHGHLEVANLLLEKGADITIGNDYKWTPLFAASHNGHVDMVKLLLDKGADTTVANDKTWTPLFAASDNGHVEVVKLLLDKGADFTVETEHGWTPLQAALNHDYKEVTDLLLDKGASR